MAALSMLAALPGVPDVLCADGLSWQSDGARQTGDSNGPAPAAPSEPTAETDDDLLPALPHDLGGELPAAGSRCRKAGHELALGPASSHALVPERPPRA